MKKRRSVVAANWKMNVLPSEAAGLAGKIKENTIGLNVDIVVAPPYTHLALMSHLISDHFSLGAQNVHPASSGAYTSEISAAMLKDLQVKYVILGHSERRQAYHNESELLPQRIKACLQSGLKVIYCCGEPLQVRQEKKEFDFVRQQLDLDFNEMTQWDHQNIIIAYEPVWAIGTGLNATPEQANEMHQFIRTWLQVRFHKENSELTKILYGGSVKATNAAELAGMNNIDGALVGGASLYAEEFASIARCWSGLGVM